MFRLKSFRLVLVLLFLTAAVAIAWNFIARRGSERPARRTAMLSPHETRSMTGAVYQERKGGNVSFEVRADISIESSTGIYSLKKVSLTRFDDAGKPTNLVSGKEAIYDTGQKQIAFTGDVQLKLADGTDIYSQNIAADLKQEVVRIADNFRFKRGDAAGEGRSLEYLIEPKQVSVDGMFQLILPLDEGGVTIRAMKAFHDIPTHHVDLIGQASIEGEDNRLSADRIAVDMNEQNRLERSLGTGGARLAIGPDRSFSGEQILLVFNPSEDTLTTLQVSEGGPRSRAVYEERTPQGLSRLESSRIVVNPGPDPAGGEKVVLRNFTADENVILKSDSLGITDSHADHLVGTFAPGGKDLKQVDMTGHVLVVRNSTDKARNVTEERLTGKSLQLTFLPGQVLDRAEARDQVQLVSKTANSTRHLTARDAVRVFYKDGRPDRVESSGGSRLEEKLPEGRRTATAPTMTATYKEGVLDRVGADNGVTVTVEQKGSLRTATSRRLDASYSQGELTEIFQQGNVRIHDEQEQSKADLRADRTHYDARTQLLVATGSPAPVLRYVARSKDNNPGRETETTAARIEFDRQADRIRGEGAVKTLLHDNEDLIVVQAGLVEADRKSGWAVYSKSPKITQRTGSVSGRIIRYSSEEQKLVVDDDVVTTASQGDKKYRVVSEHLVYDRQSGRARYEGGVELTSADLNVKAPFVELVFSRGEAEQNRISEVIAWGGVELVQGGRKAKGTRAIYYPDNQKVVMTSGTQVSETSARP